MSDREVNITCTHIEDCSENDSDDVPLSLRRRRSRSPPAQGPPASTRRASKRRRSSSGRSSSSDTSKVEVKRSKRSEYNCDYQALMNKVSVLTDALIQNMVLPTPQIIERASSVPVPTTFNVMHGSAEETARQPDSFNEPSFEFHLLRPIANTSAAPEPRLLNLSHVTTSLKEPKVPHADPEHLKRLQILQKFGDSSWKDVRYTEALKIHNATPGFVDLDVNDELRQFVKGNDYTAKSEKIIATICNGLITQRDIVNQNLQEFINWTASPGTVLSVDNIFVKINDMFQSTSKFSKLSEEIMQMVCGKRAEYIENRRERILSEVPNKNLREGLRKIPPSSKYLFDETQLRSYIQNTGGMDKWVRPWFSAEKGAHKSNTRPSKSNQAGSSRDLTNTQTFRPREGESSAKGKKTYASPSKQPDQRRPKKQFRKDTQSCKKHFDK